VVLLPGPCFPNQGGFVNELAKTNIRDWAEESVQISLKTVFNNLDPEITKFVDVPIGYEADAQKAARMRVALAWWAPARNPGGARRSAAG
jgi:hypothetical protein